MESKELHLYPLVPKSDSVQLGYTPRKWFWDDEIGDPRSSYLVSVHSVYASQSLSVRDHGGDDKTNEANDGFSSLLFS